METVSRSAANNTEQDPTQKPRRSLQELLSPELVQEQHLGDSATVNAQFWLDRLPLRITAGWSMAAGLLAGGWHWNPGALAWSSLVLLWLLVDPIWGSIWRLAAGRSESLDLSGRVRTTRFWLPYLERGSPAAQLLGEDGPASLPLLYRIALPSVIIGLLISSALGLTALGMTTVVTALGLIGWISLRVLHRTPVLLYAVVAVALPWLLTLDLLGVSGDRPDWNLQFVMVLLWVLHTWGAERTLLHRNDWLAVAGMAVADIGIGVLLIIAQTPLWLALLAILWLPTWLAVYQRRSLRRQQIWWLAAMLISALALGQNG
jgi:hypothetical protein